MESVLFCWLPRKLGGGWRCLSCFEFFRGDGTARLVFRAPVSFGLRGRSLTEDNIKNAFQLAYLLDAKLGNNIKKNLQPLIFAWKETKERLSPSLEPTASELENAGMISHPAKASHSRQNIPLSS